MKQLTKKAKLFLAFACALCVCLGAMFFGTAINASADDATLVDGCEQIMTEPVGLLHIETGKVKKMTYHGLYKVDGKVAYYFSNAAENGAGETRFSTLNTDTTPNSGSRLYDVNHSVTKITFNYKVRNTSTTAVADDNVSTYLLQVFGPNNVEGSTAADKYNGRGWTAVDYTENSAWQTMSIDLTEDDRDIFSGFIFKMGGLTGELLIADIKLEIESDLGAMTQVTEEPSDGVLHLEAGAKLKNMEFGGYYNVDGKTAYYYHNDNPAAGNGETRFVTAGTNTQTKPYVFDQYDAYSVSFNYKIKNDCTTNVKDKETAYICQVLGSDGSYPILDFTPTIDNEWHRQTYFLTSAQTAVFSGLIVKMGGLNGEMLIADVKVEKSLINGCETATEPAGLVHIESAKVKGMTYGGLYNVDGKAAYYYHNETVTADGETRFVTEGTDTTVKVNGSYIFAQLNVKSFSFSYKLINQCTKGVADRPADNYICQIIGDDGTYDILEFTPVIDGQWHEYSYTLSEAQTRKFAGFIVKMGGLEGEMLIADINVEESPMIFDCEKNTTEPAGLLHMETGKVKEMTYEGLYNVDGKVAYYFTNSTKTGAGETRFATNGTDTTPSSGSRIYAVDHSVLKITFSYKVRNTSTAVVADDKVSKYLLQIYGPNNVEGSTAADKYNGYGWEAVDYTTSKEWQTKTLVLSADDRDIFSGFIFKMGNLQGELLIADIQVETDKVAPVITVGEATKTEYAIGETPSIVATANDAVDGDVNVTVTYPEGALDSDGKLVLGEWKVTLTAKDIAGNTATKAIDFIVKDNVAPVVTAKDNVAFRTGTAFDESKLEISVTDNVDETVSHTVTLENGAVDANGKLNSGKWYVTIVAKDAAGNEGKKVVTIEVSFITGCEEVSEEVDVLHIETKKVKNATYHGVYEVDGRKAYYFTNETALGKGKNMEARFSYGATDTSPSDSSKRVYESYKAKKISFEYKIVNAVSLNCDDIATAYIVQTFGVLTPGGKDCKYPIHNVTVGTDGEWHKITIDFNAEDFAIQFSGFIFKTGGLEGELLIANIVVEDSVAPVITLDENNKTVYTVGEELNILATANDERDGAVEVAKEMPDGMIVDGKLVEGKWTVVLTAVDMYGNKAIKRVEIEVKKANTPPDESSSSSDSGTSDSGSTSEKPSSSDDGKTSEDSSKTEAGGCFGSVTGVASLAVVTIMAAAFVVVKKKKD